jgi:hypothetical protein
MFTILNTEPSQDAMCIIAAPILGKYSRWSSNSRVIDDVPPSQPLHEDSDPRWSSGDQVATDKAPSQPPARRRMILGPSRVSAINESLRHPTEMKNVKRITVKITSPDVRHPSSWSKPKLVVSDLSRFRCFDEELPRPMQAHACSV